jgi:hypothetical protein
MQQTVLPMADFEAKSRVRELEEFGTNKPEWEAFCRPEKFCKIPPVRFDFLPK